MNFENIVLDELKKEDGKILICEDGVFPLSPFIAFAAFKRKIFNKLKKSKAFVTVGAVKKAARKVKAKALMTKEKAKATVGITSGGKEGTVYKLTPEQVKVMSYVYNKYGSKLINEILSFRKDVLAPYQLIKRIVKKSGRVGSKDILGMTHEEFKSALETGRKKIEARGETFFEKSKGKQERLNTLNDRIESLQQLKKSFEAGAKPNYNIANKVFKTFGASKDEFEGYSREDLKKVYGAIKRNKDEIKKELIRIKGIGRELTPSDFARSSELVKKSKQLWHGKGFDFTRLEGMTKGGSFDSALGKYFFSREIWGELTGGSNLSIFKQTYLSIIDKMLQKNRERKKGEFTKLVKGKREIEFNNKEAKIWKLRPEIKTKYSSNIRDYYQAVTDKDFLEKPIAIRRSPQLKSAEQKIENAIRRFERKLGKIVTASDLQKLKRFRLINNLITVREIHSPEKLFKSKEEMNKEFDKQDDDYLSRDRFSRKIREIATVEYDTMTELEKAKVEAEDLADKMIAQGDEDVVDNLESILRQIKMRRTPSAQKIVGQKFTPVGLVDIDDVEKLANEIVKKDYDSTQDIKHDKKRLDSIIQKYKEADPEAERNLGEIEFLMQRVNRKLARGAL